MVLVLVLASVAPTSGQTLQLAGGALEIRETLVYNSDVDSFRGSNRLTDPPRHRPSSPTWELRWSRLSL